jgi:hypothetical protein
LAVATESLSIPNEQFSGIQAPPKFTLVEVVWQVGFDAPAMLHSADGCDCHVYSRKRLFEYLSMQGANRMGIIHT